MRRRWILLLAVTLLTGLMLAACDSDTDGDGGEMIGAPTREPLEGEPTPTRADPQSGGDESEATPAATPDPDATPEDEQGSGVQTEHSSSIANATAAMQFAANGDGTVGEEGATVENYAAADAGEVDIRRDRDHLVLEDVRTAYGWSYREDDDGDDEIDLQFAREGQRVDFEAAVEDGVVHVEVTPER